MLPHRYLDIVIGFSLASLAVLGLGACTSPAATEAPDPVALHQDLAQHYAPVIHQGVASDQDFITAVDFDGDWIGNNNWENQPNGDLSAYVYYSVVETESHWFLFYSLFHPRDYTGDPCEDTGGCHENDMESVQVIVAKDGTGLGHLQAVQTLAHRNIYLYAIDPSVGQNALKVSGSVDLEGSHPVV